MVNQYETVFIMTPVLSEEQMKETVKKFRDYLTDKGAEIVFEDNWGMRKLSYPIQKKSTGFYHLIEFKAEGNILLDTYLQKALPVGFDPGAVSVGPMYETKCLDQLRYRAGGRPFVLKVFSYQLLCLLDLSIELVRGCAVQN